LKEVDSLGVIYPYLSNPNKDFFFLLRYPSADVPSKALEKGKPVERQRRKAASLKPI